LKRLFFLMILLTSLITASCIPAAIGVVGWYSLTTVKDEKQILADKSECEEKVMKIIEDRKTEIQAKDNTETRISVVDQIFQKEFSACMKSKAYYKATDSNGTKSN